MTIDGPEYQNLHVYRIPERRWQQFAAAHDEKAPVWSPAGDRLVFASNRDGAFNLYVMPADGEGRERVTWSPNQQLPFSWSHDGRFIAYQEQDRENSWSIWILPLDGERKPWRWGPDGTTYPYPMPAFSPDGRWLAYQSLEVGGRYQVQVRPFPGPGPRRTVSGPEGGMAPVWSPDGREILFMPASETDNRLLAVDVPSTPSLQFTNPRVAFAFPFPPTSLFFGLAPDGRRLVKVRGDPGQLNLPGIPSLTLIRHWAEEVKAKVGK